MEASVSKALLHSATVTGHVASSVLSAYSSLSRLTEGKDLVELSTRIGNKWC